MSNTDKPITLIRSFLDYPGKTKFGPEGYFNSLASAGFVDISNRLRRHWIMKVQGKGYVHGDPSVSDWHPQAQSMRLIKELLEHSYLSKLTISLSDLETKPAAQAPPSCDA